MQNQTEPRYLVRARDIEHLSSMVSERDPLIARALAECVLDRAACRYAGEKEGDPYRITVLFEDGTSLQFGLDRDRDAEVASLTESLPHFERLEWYELCARINGFLKRPFTLREIEDAGKKALREGGFPWNGSKK